MAKEVAAGHYAKLIDLLDEMPSSAHWRAAQANDTRFVELITENELPEDERLSPVDYTLTNSQLDLLIDYIAAYMSEGKAKPRPRPKTLLGEKVEALATERERRRARETLKKGLEMFAPHLVEH